MKILNFGSLNIDHTYQVAHFVSEGETLSSTGYAMHLGGKGLNQSISLARAGAQVFHAGLVGADGGPLKQALQGAGVNVDHVRETAFPSGHAIIQVDDMGRNCILLYGGANQQMTEAFFDEVLADFGPGNLLLLQNEINELPLLIQKASAKGLRIVLNPSPVSAALAKAPLDLVDLFVLNEVEGEALSGETQPARILQALLAVYPQSAFVLTLGKRGALYADRQQQHQVEACDVEAVDTTGAGDTFTGYFLCAYVQGASPREAMEWAAQAAALSVSREGAAQSIPTAHEVEAFWKQPSPCR